MMRFELARTIEVLERTPSVLSSMLSGLSEQWTFADEGDDTFSPWDVVGHMLHGEETDWIPRAEIILNQGTARPFDPFDRFIFREKYRGVSLGELLKAFDEARSRNLERLREFEIDEKALGLEGEHPDLGRVTLRQLLATWTVHDLAHVRQIARVLAKQYHDDVGPWARYLRVFQE